MSTPSPSGSTGAVDEKSHHVEHVDRIATHDRVPGHENYYEKNGLRTYGDGEDHDTEPEVCPTLPL
jgi:hypothetical protein